MPVVYPPSFPPKRPSNSPAETPPTSTQQAPQSEIPKAQQPAPKSAPAEIVASDQPISWTAVCGYIAGGFLLLLGVLSLAESKDPELGGFADAAQGIKSATGFALLAAGANTVMIASICQHTKKQVNPIYEKLIK